jgi:hypothetical protein
MTELPRDPDLDDLPDDIPADAVLFVEGTDPETGERLREPITPVDLAAGLADKRRHEDRDAE